MSYANDRFRKGLPAVPEPLTTRITPADFPKLINGGQPAPKPDTDHAMARIKDLERMVEELLEFNEVASKTIERLEGRVRKLEAHYRDTGLTETRAVKYERMEIEVLKVLRQLPAGIWLSHSQIADGAGMGEEDRKSLSTVLDRLRIDPARIRARGKGSGTTYAIQE